VRRPAFVFWGTAVAVAAVFAILAALLLPFEALGIHTLAERQRAWLLTLWTGGTLGVLFGVSALLGAFGGIGVREVLEAGGLQQATKAYREGRGRSASEFHRSFGWWLVAVGALLIAVYFAAWTVLNA
jgi:hypothetical protein